MNTRNSIPAELTIDPATSGTLEPYRVVRRPVTRPANSIANDIGRSAKPDSAMDAPNP